MTIYFEGDGKSKAVTTEQARDQFIFALKAKRDEVLNDPELDSYEDSAQRDRVLADKTIKGVLQVLDGDTPHFPYMNLLPGVPDEDYEEAIAAGADFFDNGGGSIGGGLADYFSMVNS